MSIPRFLPLRTTQTLTFTAALWLAACGSSSSSDGGGGGGGTGGSGAGSSGGSAGVSGASGSSGSGGQAGSSGTGGASGSGGSAGTSGAAGSGATAGSGGGAGAGAGGGAGVDAGIGGSGASAGSGGMAGADAGADASAGAGGTAGSSGSSGGGGASAGAAGTAGSGATSGASGTGGAAGASGAGGSSGSSGSGGSSGAGGAAGAGGTSGAGGAAGVGGTSGAGGAAGAGGSSGSGGTGGVAYPATNQCGMLGMLELGEVARYCGKVNVHTNSSDAWEVDSDCSSGCNLDTVTYCQKFYPTADHIVSVPVSSDLKPFTQGGGTAPACGGVENSPGQAQSACCDNPCGAGSLPVGMYGEWCGKVNVHTNSSGDWEVDSDCSSGCEAGNGSLSYCQRFYPGATSVVQVAVTSEQKPYTTGGCGSVTPSVGQEQFVCCAPIAP